MKAILQFTTTALALAAALTSFTQRAAAAEFAVDRGKSSIEVDVKATGHRFTCKLSKYSIRITGDEGSLTPEKVDLGWDFIDLITGDKKRDSEMLAWLEHPKFAKGSFTLSSFEKQADGKTVAVGSLKFHGVSKTIRFPVTAQRHGDELTVSGSVPVDYQDFKLDKIRMALLLTVNPVVDVRFKLTGRVR